MSSPYGKVSLNFCGLVQDGRQIGALGLVVQADGHESQRMEDPVAAFEAPAEDVGVASGHDYSRGAVVVTRSKQCFSAALVSATAWAK